MKKHFNYIYFGSVEKSLNSNYVSSVCHYVKALEGVENSHISGI